LRLREGLVRCGRCHGVFDGAAERVALPQAAEPPATANPAPPGEPAPVVGETAAAPDYRLSPAWDPWSPRIDERTEPTFPSDAGAGADAGADARADARISRPEQPAAESARTSGTTRVFASGAAPAPRPGPETAAPAGDSFPVTVEARRETSWGVRLAWRILGSLVALALLLVLLAQLAWWQREQVILRWPPAQGLYARACALAGCTVGPVRIIEGLQIESPQLQRVNSPTRLELRMVLHNVTASTLVYPAIELTLLDSKNNVTVRRVIWPQDYLPAHVAAAAGLAPRARQLLLMRLDTSNIAAVNYRIIIFYP
jgi:hypothetical protein